MSRLEEATKSAVKSAVKSAADARAGPVGMGPVGMGSVGMGSVGMGLEPVAAEHDEAAVISAMPLIGLSGRTQKVEWVVSVTPWVGQGMTKPWPDAMEFKTAGGPDHLCRNQPQSGFGGREPQPPAVLRHGGGPDGRPH